MTWLDEHRQSEGLASLAEVAAHEGDSYRAREFYVGAAAAEERALWLVEPDKARTYGIIAVSAASLLYKSGQYEETLALAYRCLGTECLPSFAWQQLDEVVGMAKAQLSIARWATTSVIVSLKEGDELIDAAPIDLVLSRFKHLESFLYRTAEFLHDVPYRRSGRPSQDIRDAYQPWLFQVHSPGCQFGVSVGGVPDGSDTGCDRESRTRVLHRLHDIMFACAESPVAGLAGEIPDPEYRGAFLRLARDLAPSRGSYDCLDIRFPHHPNPVVLSYDAREVITDALKDEGAGQGVVALREAAEEFPVTGRLRAVDLEHDWIELSSQSGRVRVKGIGREVDDTIGPMVNRMVSVHAVRTGGELQFRRIAEVEP